MGITGILSDQATTGGGHWGVPNTSIPQEKLANTEYRVENRPNTDTAFRSLRNRSRLLKSASILHVYLSQACTHYVKDLSVLIAYLLTFIALLCFVLHRITVVTLIWYLADKKGKV